MYFALHFNHVHSQLASYVHTHKIVGTCVHYFKPQYKLTKMKERLVQFFEIEVMVSSIKFYQGRGKFNPYNKKWV